METGRPTEVSALGDFEFSAGPGQYRLSSYDSDWENHPEQREPRWRESYVTRRKSVPGEDHQVSLTPEEWIFPPTEDGMWIEAGSMDPPIQHWEVIEGLLQPEGQPPGPFLHLQESQEDLSLGENQMTVMNSTISMLVAELVGVEQQETGMWILMILTLTREDHRQEPCGLKVLLVNLGGKEQAFESIPRWQSR